MSRAVWGWLIALGLGLAPAPAAACTRLCEASIAPASLPSGPFVQVPANGAFVTVHQPTGLEAATLTIVRERNGVSETFTVPATTDAIALPDPRVADHFTITLEGGCRPVETRLHVMPEAALPTAFGVLEVDASQIEDVEVIDRGGLCYSTLRAAVAHYDVALDASWDAWSTQIERTTYVDGVVWNAAAYPDAIVAHCDALTATQEPGDTTPGAHTLRVEAHVRGTSITFSSEEVPFELTCTPRSTSGCTVSHAPATGSFFGWGLLAAAAAALLARRRT